MYIKSQTHPNITNMIINTEIVTIMVVERAIKAFIIGQPNAVTLGVYSSKEIAQEVFDEIFQRLDHETIYEMPEYE